MTRKIPTKINKVIFINPFPYYASGTNEATIYPPLGIAYLAAVLEKNNIECKIIDAAVLRMTTKNIARKIKKFNLLANRYIASKKDKEWAALFLYIYHIHQCHYKQQVLSA